MAVCGFWLCIQLNVFCHVYYCRLEMLQQIADRVKRDCVAGEDKLVLAQASLQSVSIGTVRTSLKSAFLHGNLTPVYLNLFSRI